MRGETTIGSVSGSMTQGQSQIDLINASWARIRATEAEVLSIKSKVAKAESRAKVLKGLLSAQEAIVVD